MLKIRGRVLPSTLAADPPAGPSAPTASAVRGRDARSAGGRAPAGASGSSPSRRAHEPALDGHRARPTWCCSGPGSLFTSVLPHLAVPELAEAVAEAPGRRAYICNVMTQPGETDGFDAADHLERVLEAVPGGVDTIVVHEGPLDPEVAAAYAAQGQEPVRADARPP